MRAPRAETGPVGDDPVARGDGADSGAGAEDLEDAFVAGDGGGEGRAERGGEGREGGVDALDLVDVGRVEGGGEGAQGEEGGVRGGEGMCVETVVVGGRSGEWWFCGGDRRGQEEGGNVREDVFGVAVFGVDEGFGLFVAVGGDWTVVGRGVEEEGWGIADGRGGLEDWAGED